MTRSGLMLLLGVWALVAAGICATKEWTIPMIVAAAIGGILLTQYDSTVRNQK